MQRATLRQLRAFSVVARHRSFSRAAAELHLTPSAVSLQIKELEHAVGVPLFGRGGKAASLTSAGELLLHDVNRALDGLKEAEEKLGRLRGVETGVVSIGIVSNAKYFLFRLLGRYRVAHPGVELRLCVGNRDQLLHKLSNREVDFAVMGSPPAAMEARCETIAAQPLAIVAAPEHRLAGRSGIAPQELESCEFIIREAGSGTRAVMDRYFEQEHISPGRAMELASNGSIKQAVIANMGGAFISLYTASLELDAKLLVVLDVVGLPLMRHWRLVDMRSSTLSDAAESIRSFILKAGCEAVTTQFGTARVTSTFI